MLKMQSNKATGETCILTVKSGHKAHFNDIHNAVEYVGIMRGLYARNHRRTAGEPYPVRCLNPGMFPIKVYAKEVERRYKRGKL